MSHQPHKYLDDNPNYPAIPEQTKDQNPSIKNLSPFTWTHLKLPAINQKIKPKTNLQIIIDNSKVSQNKSKVKSPSANKNRKKQIKLKSLNKTIDIDNNIESHQREYKQIYKTRYQAHQSRQKVASMIQKQDNKIEAYKKQIILKHLKKKQNSSQIQYSNLPITSQNILPITSRSKSPKRSRLRSPIYSPIHLTPNQIQVVPKTYYYNKIQKFIKQGIHDSGWVLAKNTQIPELLWTDKYLQKELQKGQIHNHIKNSHLLTMKNNFHQFQSSYGSQFYPTSFCLPFQYNDFCTQYQQSLVKSALKYIIQIARKDHLLPEIQKIDISLGNILQQIIGNSSQKQTEATLLALKLCLYLQNYRKAKNYKYFEIYEYYRSVETNLQKSVIEQVVKFCYQSVISYTKLGSHNFLTKNLKLNQINQDVLKVLFHYYRMFAKFQKIDKSVNLHNLWIVKPIASSRGAGIFMLKNSIEYTKTFCQKHEYTHTKKFNNKIIQKYIDSPYLIKNPQNFKNRKFDNRHWVLVICHQRNKPIIYIYEQGYSRFSQLNYEITDYSHKDQQRIHLTNYSIFKKTNTKAIESIQMLEEVFKSNKQLNKQQYNKKLQKIVIQTILNNKQLVFEEGKFQLFGYDVLIDQKQNLWLLEINLNPACQASRSQSLQKQAQNMVKQMLLLVTPSIRTTEQINKKWKLLYGEDNRQIINSLKIESQIIKDVFEQYECDENLKKSTEIRPFYGQKLEYKQSLIEQVRKRNIMMKAISKITILIGCCTAFYKIKNTNLYECLQEKQQLQSSEKPEKQDQQLKQKNLQSQKEYKN